jgi:Tfp pilus assembly protein PilZ
MKQRQRDKREQVRVPLRMQIKTLRQFLPTHSSQLVDISHTGMKLMTTSPKVGEQIGLVMEVSNQTIELWGTINWATAVGPGGYSLIGISYIVVDRTKAQFLRDYIEQAITQRLGKQRATRKIKLSGLPACLSA